MTIMKSSTPNPLRAPRPTAKNWRAFSLVATMTAVTLVAGCSPDNDAAKSSGTASNVTLTPDQKKTIHFYTVTQSSFHKSIEATGIVDFDNDQATSILAPFAGPVSKLLVSPGATVRKGDPLATVDSPDFATAVGAYRKAVAAARTLRRLANLEKDLLAHKSVSQREAEQTESDAVGAESDRDAALEALVALNIDPKTIRAVRSGRSVPQIEGVIRAPIDGTLVEKLITPGELLQAGVTPCFTVANLSRVWVMAQIFGADLASVTIGDTAHVETGIDQKGFVGKVDYIAALVDPTTRSVAVRIAVDNPGGLLKKQMYVHVLIEARQENRGTLIPVSAILRDDQNLPFVYVGQRDGSFARRHVTLGDRSGDGYETTAGLRAGDHIVIDGALFVQFLQDQ